MTLSSGIELCLVAGGLSFLVTGVSIPLAERLGVLDRPAAGKIHSRVVPRLGGMGIVLGTLLPLVLWWRAEGWSLVEGACYVGGALVVASTGLVDDVRGLRPWPKLAFTAGAGGVLGLGLVTSWSLGALAAWIGAVLVVTAVCHAVNLLDGLDGLAAGVAAMAVAAMAARLQLTEAAGGIVVVAAFLGALLGFIPWNWHPARTFMGDVGSLFLGYTLGALLLWPTPRSESVPWLAGGLVILGVPLGDVMLTVLRRSAQGRPLFRPDPYHFYNVLMLRGLSHRAAVLAACGCGGLLGTLGLLISDQSVGVALGAMGATVVGGLAVAWRLGFLRDWEAGGGDATGTRQGPSRAGALTHLEAAD